MTDGDVALSQCMEPVLIKDLMNKSEILIVAEYACIVNNDSAGLLSSVLQSIQTKVCLHCNVGSFGTVYTEDSALLVNTVKHSDQPFPFQQ